MLTTKRNKNQIPKLPKNVYEQIQQIRLDNTSGSAELAKQAAEVLIFLVDNVSVKSPSKLINLIQYTTDELIKAQPMMASIFNLANTTLLENIGLENKDEIILLFFDEEILRVKIVDALQAYTNNKLEQWDRVNLEKELK